MKSFIGIWVLASLVACSTLKTDVRRVNKAIERHRDTVAAITRGAFPCTTTKIDTVTKVEFEWIEIECPDSGRITVKRDTVTKFVNGKTVRVPQEVKTIYIRTEIEDSAKIVIMQKMINQSLEIRDKQLKTIAERDATIAEKDKKIGTRGKWNLYLGAAVLALAVLNYLQFRRK